MNIIPDPLLVALQILPLLALLAGLQAILFKPMLAYLKDREQATDGTKAEALQITDRAESLTAKYEALVAAATATIAESRATRRAASQADYARVIAVARAEAEVHANNAAAILRTQADYARNDMKALTGSLSNDIAGRVLGRPVEA